MKILITEFMDQRSVENLMKKYDVIYDTTLASDQDRIPALIYNIDAIIFTNLFLIINTQLCNCHRLPPG